MKKIFKNRLLKLADHLESANRGHKVFRFEDLTNSDGHTCGTAGCAMGELPVLFPRHFKFEKNTIMLRKNASGFFSKDVRDFLGLERGQDDHLFYPGQQNVETYGGQVMGPLTRPKTVAKQIRTLIKKVEETESRAKEVVSVFS